MGFKSKAAVAVSGALTAGAFATLAGAIPAGAATFGTEQSEAGVVFAVGNNSAIVGANHTGLNTEFSQSVHGNTVVFSAGNNRCVTDGFGGLSLQHCNNSRSQKFDEVGFGQFVALQNEDSHQYVTEHGQGRQVTTESVRSYGRNRRLNFSRSQEWRWTTFNVGGGQGGGNGGGRGPGRGGNPNPSQPGTWTASTRVTDDGDTGYGTPSIWADLDFTRVASIKLVGPAAATNCGGASPCYKYTGVLNDENGTLTTVQGAGSPNQSGTYMGDKETFVKHGTFHGFADTTFYANSNRPNARSVVGSHNDGGLHPSTPSVYSVSDWVEQFFPDGTNFGAGPQTGTYDYKYAAGNQSWEDSSTNGDGDQPQDGNIFS